MCESAGVQILGWSNVFLEEFVGESAFLWGASMSRSRCRSSARTQMPLHNRRHVPVMEL